MNKFIDVAKILKDKNPGAYKWMPGFLISWLKRIIHEDRLNAFQSRAHHLRGLDYCDATIEELGLKIVCKGLENVPTEGGCILVSNHPIGAMDGISLLQQIGRRRKDVRFLVNDILTRLQGFAELFVPVNKVGSTSMDNLRRIEEVFASDMAVLVFPAGLVSRKQGDVIQDLAWNKSFVVKAQKYNKPIIPVHISGRLSNWFYGLSKFRKMIGIKANIEMLYLADEMFGMEGSTITITIGKPIAPETIDKRFNAQQWAACFRAYIYDMAQNPESDFAEFARKYKA
ncbi:MAG: hypothetical protein RL660_839 [Bacteroidota bacterium]|jgi:putative hemolysin